MKKVRIFILFALFAAFSFTACHKHGDGNDTLAPTVTITSPTADASLSGAVNISGTVTDEGMHEMSIVVTKDADNTQLFKAEPNVYNATDYAISQVWTPAGIAAETAVTLTVTVEDHSANKTVKTVKFKVKP